MTGAPTARLKVRDRSEERVVPVDKDVFTIGRRSESDLQFGGSDISRDHARISLVDGRYVVEDCGSRYGTFVNGTRVTEHQLVHGDRIELGRSATVVLTWLVLDAHQTSDTGPAIAGDLPQIAEFLESLRGIGTERLLDDVLTHVLDLAIDRTGAQRGAILLARTDGALEVTAARARGRQLLPIAGLAISEKIARRVFETGVDQFVRDLVHDQDDRHSATIAFGIRYVLCVPLLDVPLAEPGKTPPPIRNIGVLYLDSTEPGRLVSRATKSELGTLAREAAAAIERARLYRGAMDKARVDRELQQAADLQRALLPPPRRETGFFDADGASIPCRAVGGDFFEYLSLPEGWFGFVVADVAGKGPPAAIMAAVLQGIVSALGTLGGDMCQLAQRVNLALAGRRLEARFATSVFASLSPGGVLTYSNAGHNPPFLVSGHSLTRLEAGGPVLGLFPGASYEQGAVQLAPNDTVVMFSDGVPEALGPGADEYGDARIAEVCLSNRGRPPADIVTALLDSVQEFTRGEPQHDDITVVVVRYAP